MRTLRLAATMALALTGVGWGVAGAGTIDGSTSAAGTATVIQPITISTTEDLRFGDFFSGPTSGTVVVNTSGVRSFTGGVTLLASMVSQARFLVTGKPGHSYAITLPGPIQITSGLNSMQVDDFASIPGGIGIIGGDGTHTIHVGARLNVGANQAPGSYAGTFDVTVAYN